MDRNRLSTILLSVATLVAALFVPLIVKLRLVELPTAFILNGYASILLDGFSWYKAIALIVCGSLALVGLLLHKGPWTFEDSLLALLALLALLSAFLSPYRALTLWGVPYIFEGWPSSVAYCILTMAAMRLPDSMVKRYLPWGIASVMLIIALFGLAEIGGKLLVNEPWLASWLLNTGTEISPYAAGFGAASFPFGNPNYMGMYAAMIWSFLFAFALTRKSLGQGLIISACAATAFALLLASMCRGGFIAATVSASLGFVILLFRQRPRFLNAVSFIALHGLAYSLIAFYTASRTIERVSTVPPQFAVENFKRADPTPPTVPVPVATFANIYLEQGRLKVEGNGPQGPFVLLIERFYNSVKFMDDRYMPLAFKVGGTTEGESSKVELLDARYGGLAMTLKDAGAFRILTMNGIDVAITNWGFRIGRVGAFVTPVKSVRFPLPFPDSAFSFRGFVWSYSLPLLKDTLILGHGAGSFPFDFPNNDFIKMSEIFGPKGLVDKPHNFYISFAHTHGVLALIMLLILLGRMFWLKGRGLCAGRAIDRDLPYILGCLGFLITGISVDSMIGVSAIFWILLGVGLQKASSRDEKTPSNANEIISH